MKKERINKQEQNRRVHIKFFLFVYARTSESRSEESVKKLGDPVGRVLKEIDPEKSRFSRNPTLAFSNLNPKGHPSSWFINQLKLKIENVTRYSEVYYVKKLGERPVEPSVHSIS